MMIKSWAWIMGAALLLTACAYTEHEPSAGFTYFRDCEGCPDMIDVPMPDGGSVAFANAEVTVGQFRACVEAGACTYTRDAGFWAMHMPETHPQSFLRYYDALDYAQYLSELTGEAYRLPTLYEWMAAVSDADGNYAEDIDQVMSLSSDFDRYEVPGDLVEYRPGFGAIPLSQMWLQPRGVVSGCGFGANLHGICSMTGSLYEWLETCADESGARCVGKYIIGGSYLSGRRTLSQRPNKEVLPIDLEDREYIEGRKLLGVRLDDPDYDGRNATHNLTTGARVVRD